MSTDKDVTAHWSDATDGWARWAARSNHLVPATERMLDLAAVALGSQVLDVGCGSGEQTIIAARRVGEKGRVIAIDIAAPMIAATERNVAAAALGNVTTRVCAAEGLTDDAGSFDAAISRLVLMLIPDPVAAGRAVLTALRPGAAFAAIVPGDPLKNPLQSIPLEILARHGGKTLPAGQPGIFALSDPARLAAVFQSAGFTDIEVTNVPTNQRLANAAMATSMIHDGYAFYRALISDQPQGVQDAAWTEVASGLSKLEDEDGLTAPGELNLIVGRKPASET